MASENIDIPSLRHLHVFEKVGELGGIGKAAEAVSLSQPAVTHAIEKVKSQIGSALFERRSRGTYMNDAGRLLHSRIRMMFQQFERALMEFGVAGGKADAIASTARRITHQQITVLAAVSDSCSFVDAARKLGISPVSLHRAARELERKLGKLVFEDVSTGTVTTRAGSELARKATLALREIEWGIEEEIRSAEGSMAGELRVGGMPRSGSYLLGAVLNDLEKYFPDANVHAFVESGFQLTKALRMGEINLIVGMNHGSQRTPDIIYEELLTSPFVLVGRRNHPLASKNEISVSDLEGYQWITPNPGAARLAIFNQLFDSMSKKSFTTIKANSFSTARMMISGSNRLTLLTRFEFDHDGGADTQILPFPPIGSQLSLGVARRANWVPTPLHRKFLELLRERAAQYSGGQVFG